MYFYITYCVFVKKPKSSCNIRRQTFPVNPSRVCCFWFFKNWMVCFESALQWKNNQTFPVIYCVFDPHWVTIMRRRASPTPPPGQTPVLSMIHINISWLTFKGTKLLLPVSCWQSDMCLSLGGRVTTESSSEPVSAAHFPQVFPDDFCFWTECRQIKRIWRERWLHFLL